MTTLETVDLKLVLKEAFALDEFRLGQQDIIESVIQGRDVIAVLPTGGGKSLCYQLPAVYLKKLVIVISPLIALMKDQVESLKRLGIRAGCLHSGQSDEEKREVFSQITFDSTFILYLSPERAQKDGFKKWIATRPIGLFAIDEAHCVSQWGHDFREEYSLLHSLKTIRADVPMLALTASATPTVLNDIAKTLTISRAERKVHGFYRPNLYYQVEYCEDENVKIEILVQALKQNPSGRIIIYCGTRRVTEELSTFLKKHFKGVACYHAGLSSEERTETQTSFGAGVLRILVATNAFGMGIDQPDVRLVVHFQMPANIDALYQEMGRAGRDSKPSTCLLLYARKDKGLQTFFITSSDAPKLIKDARFRNLEALVSYSEGSECRHSEILTYYRDSQRITECGHCDNCDAETERRVLRSASAGSELGLRDFSGIISESGRRKSAGKKSSGSRRPGKSKSGRRSSKYEISLNSEQEARFHTLRKWRKAKATKLDTPAFIIFSDKTLQLIAIENPRSIRDLKGISGIGEFKLEKFGAELIALLIQ